MPPPRGISMFLSIVLSYVSIDYRYWLCGAVIRASDCEAIQFAARRFESRRRRWDSIVRQAANGPCLSRLSCINEYKVFLRCPPVYGGTTSATIRLCNGASPEVLRKKHLFPKEEEDDYRIGIYCNQ